MDRKKDYKRAELAAKASLLPIRIAQGSLGPKLPKKPLWLSQQHRILSEGTRIQEGFSDEATLIPAKALKTERGISARARDSAKLTYYHLLFDHHEIIWANGLMCESLLLGDEAWQNIGIEGRHQMRGLTSLPVEMDYKSHPCRRLISVTAVKRRLRENDKQQSEMIA